MKSVTFRFGKRRGMLERRGYNETDKRREKSGTKEAPTCCYAWRIKQCIIFNADLGPSDINLVLTFNNLDTAK